MATPRTALVGAHVVPVTSLPRPRGIVLINDGKIEAVGDESLAIPAGTETIDVTGKWILPGFVDAHTHIGTLEDGEGWAGDDHDEGTTPITARLRALDGINASDIAFRDAVAGGVLSVGVNPGSCNPIGGQSVALRTVGRTVDEMVLRQPCGLKSALGENPKQTYGSQGRLPSTRMGIAAVIREAVTRARDYDKHGGAERTVDLDLEAIAAALRGEIPWRQHVHRADDIATALRLADEFGYRLIVDHGTEAAQLADVLAARGIPVILGPLIVGRAKTELRNRSLRTAGLLAAAGVRISIATDHSVVPIQFLVHQATLAVKEGLDPVTAIEALTINPADALGIADRLGSLDAGKDADLCVWSGDPLDVMQRVEMAYVQGRKVYAYDRKAHVGRFDDFTWAP